MARHQKLATAFAATQEPRRQAKRFKQIIGTEYLRERFADCSHEDADEDYDFEHVQPDPENPNGDVTVPLVALPNLPDESAATLIVTHHEGKFTRGELAHVLRVLKPGGTVRT